MGEQTNMEFWGKFVCLSVVAAVVVVDFKIALFEIENYFCICV